MTDKKIRCVRCCGRKKLYKIATAYSNIDNGGIKVDCPLCLGEGKIEPFAEVIEDNLINSAKEGVEIAVSQILHDEDAQQKICHAVKKEKKK